MGRGVTNLIQLPKFANDLSRDLNLGIKTFYRRTLWRPPSRDAGFCRMIDHIRQSAPWARRATARGARKYGLITGRNSFQIWAK
jgi:hypothetical protein